VYDGNVSLPRFASGDEEFAAEDNCSICLGELQKGELLSQV